MKAHELARELGISQKELLNFLQQHDRRRSHNPSAPLAQTVIDAARSAFKPATVTKIETNGDRRVVLPPTLSVKDLGEKLGVSPVEVIKKLMASKILATINQVIDFATAEIVADEFGFTVEPVASEDVVAVESAEGEGDVVTTSREELFSLANEDPAKLKPRPPIVTVLGHVDHGKTSILDAIRQTHVAAGEAGGITQRIGAYKIETADAHPVVFIDTPGHEAFTAMRARGAQVTDLVVLVVAADDGVMPQTIEAIHHARAARVPIIVAINKIDKDNANVDRVHQQLAEQGIVTRHYGGEHECVHLSAKTGKGIDDLLTTIVLSSDILELKANPDRNAIGTIVDAHLERGRGPVATVLVQAGTLKVGDDFVCGHIYGRVRALADDRGRSVMEAGPATPVVVSGMSEVPQAGDIFQVVGSEKAARQIALTKLGEKRAQEAARDVTPRITLEDLARRAKEGEVKELSLRRFERDHRLLQPQADAGQHGSRRAREGRGSVLRRDLQADRGRGARGQGPARAHLPSDPRGQGRGHHPDQDSAHRSHRRKPRSGGQSQPWRLGQAFPRPRAALRGPDQLPQALQGGRARDAGRPGMRHRARGLGRLPAW